jgi:dTDP-4-amino-4,6-dideoxygalactose transaminase
MKINNGVPFLDLVSPHRTLESELVAVFRRALHTAGFIGGEMVQQFESAFATFCGTSHCVGVGSGTDALRFALVAAGVQPGDVVITVPNTFIATTEAISQAGAVPEFVDVDKQTYNMDPEKLRTYIANCTTDIHGSLVSSRSGRRVTAIVPVHLYGQMAEMDPIVELAEHHNLLVIEDACQAHGAEYLSSRTGLWKKAGSIGHAAAFSFYPGKNLGACGEAGAVTTNDETIAHKARCLRDHGQIRKYYHQMEGYNGRLDSIQAGILHTKLAFLSEWNEKRRHRARTYNELLAGSDKDQYVEVPYEAPWSKGVYHLYVIRTADRDRLQALLLEVGVGTGIHYPIPLHLQKAYEGLEYREGDFPIAENAAREILSLPMYPQIEVEQQNRVVAELSAFLSDRADGKMDLLASA